MRSRPVSGLATLRSYRRGWLGADVIAGVDATAADGLRELCEQIVAKGIDVHLSRTHSQVRTMMDRSGVPAVVGCTTFIAGLPRVYRFTSEVTET